MTRRRARRHAPARAAVALALAPVTLSTAPVPAAAQDGARDSTYAYYTVGACVQAVKRTTATFWRAGPDTMRYSPARDTLPAVSVAVARQCAAQFDAATAQRRDLVLLAELYLAAGEDSAAAAAVGRRVALEAAEPARVRARTLAEAAAVYIAARPRRLARGRTYVETLDAMHAPEAAVWRLAVHATLLTHAYDAALDDEWAAAEARSVIAAGRHLTPHDREEFGWALLRSYGVLAQLAADREGDARGADAARAVLRRARADIGALQYVAPQLDERDSVYSLYGAPASPLNGVWFGAPREESRPTRGKIALVVLTPSRQIMPALRRLAGEFGDSLEITLVAQTAGYVEGRGLMTPASEMAYLWRYYHTTLGAPGALVLSNTGFTTLPDGRRVAVPTDNQRAYKVPFGVGYVLVDREGVVRMVQTQWNERRLAAALRRLL